MENNPVAVGRLAQTTADDAVRPLGGITGLVENGPAVPCPGHPPGRGYGIDEPARGQVLEVDGVQEGAAGVGQVGHDTVVRANVGSVDGKIIAPLRQSVLVQQNFLPGFKAAFLSAVEAVFLSLQRSVVVVEAVDLYRHGKVLITYPLTHLTIQPFPKLARGR